MGIGTNLVFQIGMQEYNPDFELTVVEEACRLIGGCTVSYGNGYWVHGADKTQRRYNSPSQQEYSIRFELACVVVTVEEVYACMKAAIIRAAVKHDIDINWVHVLYIPIETRHFSVKNSDYYKRNVK